MKYLKEEMQTIAGAWNGDGPGMQEQRAMIAYQIIELIDKIEILKEKL